MKGNFGIKKDKLPMKGPMANEMRPIAISINYYAIKSYLLYLNLKPPIAFQNTMKVYD